MPLTVAAFLFVSTTRGLLGPVIGGNYTCPFPNSLMLGFTAEYAGGDLALEDAEIAEAGWFAPDALPPPISIARRLIDWFVEEYE